MRYPLFLGAVFSLLQSGTAHGQEMPAPVARPVRATGTFIGSVNGQHIDTLYNGDIVTEQIHCAISIWFYADGTVQYDAGDYLYEKFYYKKTTTGGFLVGHTRMTAEGTKGPRDRRLTLSLTQYGDVWDAVWNPIDQPSDVLEESWLTDGRGRTWGHSKPLATHPKVYCEPRILWRGKNRQGPGFKPQGKYDGPDRFYWWATVKANWNFTRAG